MLGSVIITSEGANANKECPKSEDILDYTDDLNIHIITASERQR